MAAKRSVPLSVKIIGLTVLLIVLMLGVIIVTTVTTTTEHVFETEEHNLEQIGDTIADLLDLEIHALKELTEGSSENGEVIKSIQEGDISHIEELIQHLYEKDNIFAEFIVTDKNDIILASYPDVELEGDHIDDHDEYKHVHHELEEQIKKGDMNSSLIDADAEVHEETGEAVFLLGAPISDEGDYLGNFYVVVSIREFYKDYLADKTFGKSGYGYIGDSHGRFVAHNNPVYDLKDVSDERYMSETLKAINRGDDHGTVDYIFEEREKFLYFKTLKEVDWHVSMTVYKDDLTILARDLQNSMLVYAGISLAVLIVLIALSIMFFVSNPINRVSVDLTNGADSLEAASQQIASSSQQLSSGNSELAASIEEITSSLEELQSVIEMNTKNINESELLMKETNTNSQKVSEDMGILSGALTEIGENSEEIESIVKVIEDIAFQTNILALNAAVEAGRAGEAGSGFAVVADQVKELAQKSSESAKETAKLIRKAIDSIERGQTIGISVKESQDKTSEMSSNVTVLLNEVNRASKEQMKGVNQITQAITQTNSVVQQTAAGAEETAAASEELLGQSEDVNGIVGRLNYIVTGKSDLVKKESVKTEIKPKETKVKEVKEEEKFDPEKVIPMEDEFKEF